MKIWLAGLTLFVIVSISTSDTSIFNRKWVLSNFKNKQSYPYLAADYELPDAWFYLYQQSKQIDYLYQAATLGHEQALYLVYLHTLEQGEPSELWLDKGIRLGYPAFLLIAIEQAFADSNYDKAEIWLTELNAKRHRLQALEMKRFLSFKAQYANRQQAVSAPAETPNLTPLFDNNCPVRIAAVVNNTSAKLQVERFKQSYEESLLNGLALCWQEPLVWPELTHYCGSDPQNRMECDVQAISNWAYKQTKFSHLIVVAEKGDANTRGGLMLLDNQDDANVFLHELGHWLGWLDEYPISFEQQKILCRQNTSKWLGINLFISPAEKAMKDAEALAGTSLFPVSTCQSIDAVQAYKPYHRQSFMAYYDIEIQQQDAQLLLAKLNYAKLVPAALNFSVDAKRRGDTESHRYWLLQAAQQGFESAMVEMANLLQGENKYSDAAKWLLKAAELNSATAQVLLGHAYLEGRWFPRDLNKSAYWYRIAAQQKDSYGLYFLGKCFEQGWGCALSKSQARFYFQQSAELGNHLAIRQLELMH